MSSSRAGFMRVFGLCATLMSAGCGGAVQPAVVPAAAPGAPVAPPEWAFPAASIEATYATGGMVTTTDAVASEVGLAVLRRGGNAVDAAIATHFALAVVNPEAGNIGGGGFLIARMADGETAALDFREKAPARATPDMFLDASGELTDRSLIGHLAAGVPGSVAGMWEAHVRFGSLPWAELLAPAIELADGLVVHERLAESLADYQDDLRLYPATAATFLPGGKAPVVGERFVQADLAATLRRIASEGKDGFYAGRTAELVEAEMREGGGLIDRADLAAYEAVWRDPVSFGYRDHTIISMPPPSSGGATMAEILNILEGYQFDVIEHLSSAHIHLWAEAVKRAYADRNAFLADPDFIPQPTERMTSDEYAALRRLEIRADQATPSNAILPAAWPTPPDPFALARPEGDHTTHYSIIDGEGNAVAVTTTINSLYGNLVTVAGAGFLLNNEMDDFTSRPGTPNQFGLVQGEANAIQPGKRMLSAMTPTIVLDPNGRVKLVTGSPGGATIITTVAQMVSNVIDYGMDAAEATAAPRLHHQHLPDVLRYEARGLDPAVEAELRVLGHIVEGRDGYQGDTQTILVLPDGKLMGVADPRRGGAALGVTPATGQR